MQSPHSAIANVFRFEYYEFTFVKRKSVSFFKFKIIPIQVQSFSAYRFQIGVFL